MSEVDYNPSNDWAAFCLWCSIKVNLPDALFMLKYKKKYNDEQCFGWAYKQKLFVSESNLKDKYYEKIVVIPVFSAALRDYDENNLGPVDVKTNEITTFVSYDKCGSFDILNWKSKNVVPFYKPKMRYGKGEFVNEIKLLDFWQKIFSFYWLLN